MDEVACHHQTFRYRTKHLFGMEDDSVCGHETSNGGIVESIHVFKSDWILLYNNGRSAQKSHIRYSDTPDQSAGHQSHH